jgi:hypothetical protein
MPEQFKMGRESFLLVHWWQGPSSCPPSLCQGQQGPHLDPVRPIERQPRPQHPGLELPLQPIHLLACPLLPDSLALSGPSPEPLSDFSASSWQRKTHHELFKTGSQSLPESNGGGDPPGAICPGAQQQSPGSSWRHERAPAEDSRLLCACGLWIFICMCMPHFIFHVTAVRSPLILAFPYVPSILVFYCQGLPCILYDSISQFSSSF